MVAVELDLPGVTVVPIRQADGRYAESAASEAFPFLTAAEISDWVHRPQTSSDTQWRRELRLWVAQTLLARRGGQP